MIESFRGAQLQPLAGIGLAPHRGHGMHRAQAARSFPVQLLGAAVRADFTGIENPLAAGAAALDEKASGIELGLVMVQG